MEPFINNISGFPNSPMDVFIDFPCLALVWNSANDHGIEIRRELLFSPLNGFLVLSNELINSNQLCGWADLYLFKKSFPKISSSSNMNSLLTLIPPHGPPLAGSISSVVIVFVVLWVVVSAIFSVKKWIKYINTYRSYVFYIKKHHYFLNKDDYNSLYLAVIHHYKWFTMVQCLILVL